MIGGRKQWGVMNVTFLLRTYSCFKSSSSEVDSLKRKKKSNIYIYIYMYKYISASSLGSTQNIIYIYIYIYQPVH